MYKIVLVSAFIFSLIFVAGCKKEKSEATQNIEGKSTTSGSGQLTEDLTDEHFKKGMDISNIVMLSLKSGKPLNFQEFKGKTIIIDFWSSWCKPCIEMFPDLNRLKKEFEDIENGKVKIVSVSVDPMPAKIKEIMKEKNVEFEVLQAPESLQNAGILLPYTLLINENGIITKAMNGKHSYEELKSFLEIK